MTNNSFVGRVLRTQLSYLRLLFRSPSQALRRGLETLEVGWEQLRAPVEQPAEPLPLEAALEALDRRTGLGARARLEEPQLQSRLQRIEEQARGLPGDDGKIGVYYIGADAELARACYAICRAIAPSTVVETGVSYGVTTATLLTALEQNGEGVLHSVDRPPLTAPDRSWTGTLVPEHLEYLWTLHAGSSRALLPGVLEEVEGMSVFVHDSLHTHRNMSFELEQAMASLATSGVILVDDVDDNNAFAEWIKATEPSFWAVIQQEQKESYFGLAYFDEP